MGCTRQFAGKNGLYALNDKSFLISIDELRQNLGRSNMRIIDCRFSLLDPAAGRQQYVEAHIPGAVHADLDKDLAAAVGQSMGRHPLPDAADMCRTFGRLGIDRDTAVVAYDDGSGGIAARAWWLLRWLGHDNAMLLDGGFAAWLESGLPVSTGVSEATPCEFAGTPRMELVLATADMDKSGVADAPYRLVDARSDGRFVGDEEPIDPVAGHIPGALNMPFDRNLDAEGRWKSPGALAKELESCLGGDREAEWVVMCGSGVTACHLVIAGLRAGFREPRVYVGSWSEWIQDPDRAIATGSE